MKKGAGIILISSYLPEVYELADILHVFRGGHLVGTNGFRETRTRKCWPKRSGSEEELK